MKKANRECPSFLIGNWQSAIGNAFNWQSEIKPNWIGNENSSTLTECFASSSGD
jgi:hypothetical protein